MAGHFVASIHNDYLPFVNLATDEELAQFIRAQICASNGEDLPELTGMAKALFDAHSALTKRLEESSKNKSEAGRRGGQRSAEVKQSSAEVKQSSAEVKQSSAEVKQSSAEVKQSSAEVKPIAVAVTITKTDTNVFQTSESVNPPPFSVADSASCAERSANSADAPHNGAGQEDECVCSLTLNDNTQYRVTAKQVEEWQSLYPAVDVRQQLRAMVGWIGANPTKRKTKSGVLRFVNAWLAKEQNKGGARNGPASATPRRNSADELWRKNMETGAMVLAMRRQREAERLAGVGNANQH